MVNQTADLSNFQYEKTHFFSKYQGTLWPIYVMRPHKKKTASFVSLQGLSYEFETEGATCYIE